MEAKPTGIAGVKVFVKKLLSETETTRARWLLSSLIPAM